MICKAIRKQFQYIRRDLGYIDRYLKEGAELPTKQEERIAVIRRVYGQQKYMYDNDIQSVLERIVSLSQSHICPIVRDKARTLTEFGAKLDLGIDDNSIVSPSKLKFLSPA